MPVGRDWIMQIFWAKAARNGGIVRRKIASVIRFASVELLLAEVKRRGFHMVTSGDEYVIFCNKGHCQLVC
jgi:hypothetical protein